MVESGDSESIVSPVRQIQLELPSPINTFFVNGAPAPNPLTDSALKQEVRAILGAAAGTDVVIFTFAKGLWKIYAWFQAQFTGTTNVGVNSGLNFSGEPRDPDFVSTRRFYSLVESRRDRRTRYPRGVSYRASVP